MPKRLPFLCVLCLYACLFAFGCASKPVLKNSEPLPEIVKEYKTVNIYGHIPGMQNTGVRLEKGDLYSMFGTGSINVWPSNPDKKRYVYSPGANTLAREGKNHAVLLSYMDFSGYILKAFYPGYLYLGLTDGGHDRYGNAKQKVYFIDNLGSFKIDIIVWQRDDFEKIADFYESLYKQNPNNPQIKLASDLANKRRAVYVAEKKATEELVKVEKQIEEIKKKAESQKAEQTKSIPEEKIIAPDAPVKLSASEQEEVNYLENKLAQLTATLAQLEEMKLKFEEERKKSDLLAKQLEEKQEILTKLEESSKTPPVIVVATPKDGITTEAPFINLTGVAIDDLGLKELNVYVNNRLIEDPDVRGLKIQERAYPKRFEFTSRIPLTKGANQIKLHAIDADGLLTERELTVTKIQLHRNFWAVVIGINSYPQIRQLNYADNDAKAFYQYLIDFNKIPPENVVLLLNEDARLTKIRSSLGTHLKNKAGKEDMVIIYFAGHGATEKDVSSPDGDGLEKYLLPYDVDPKDLYATALPMAEISRIFKRIQSERLIFIADSCYSGASGGRSISLNDIRSNLSDGFLDRIARGKGKIILTASGANEVSAEKPNLKHGVFTYFLLEGLKGKADTDQDGLITVDEAYRYVSEHVPDATDQQQHPVKKGAVEGQLILGIIE